MCSEREGKRREEGKKSREKEIEGVRGKRKEERERRERREKREERKRKEKEGKRGERYMFLPFPLESNHYIFTHSPYPLPPLPTLSGESLMIHTLTNATVTATTLTVSWN